MNELITFAEYYGKILLKKENKDDIELVERNFINTNTIFEFVAKYPVKVSIVKEQVGGDWVDATNLNIY